MVGAAVGEGVGAMVGVGVNVGAAVGIGDGVTVGSGVAVAVRSAVATGEGSGVLMSPPVQATRSRKASRDSKVVAESGDVKGMLPFERVSP